MASPPPGRLGFRRQGCEADGVVMPSDAGMAGRLILEAVRSRGRTAGQRGYIAGAGAGPEAGAGADERG